MTVVLEQLDETTLLAQCRAELPYVMTAFSELVRRHERYVFNVCRRYLGSEADAEDITQEVFMRVFHALPGFEGRSQFKTWLYRIAMNECHSEARKRKDVSYDAYSDDEGSWLDSIEGDETPHDNHAADDDRDCVQSALTHMKPRDMEILNLRFMGELSLEEIADTVSTKLSATKMRFYRAMEQFKQLYEKLCT